MATVPAPDGLAMSSSSFRQNSRSLREAWSRDGQTGDALARSSRSRSRGRDRRGDEEEELKWAALEKLPTYDRLRRGLLRQVAEDGRVVSEEVDIRSLGPQEKATLTETILRIVEHDNEEFLRRIRDRIDRVGIEVPKIEVRFEGLTVETHAYAGRRALPTLLNAARNAVEGMIGVFQGFSSKRRIHKILHNVSGILRPSRMTLLLGPPASGKSTLLLALAGKLENNLQVSGRITYCGHELSEFIPQRTCAYISQHDLHNEEMTVREILDFSGQCMGVGTRYEMLSELLRREKDASIKPDPDIDAYMKATSLEGQKSNLITDYTLKILGLETCADIIVGNHMRRGISGGQKKRLTIGEMLMGPAKAFFMDEISNGLDSSTTFQIIKFLKQMVHVMDGTMIISLLQPPPETFDLFDDIILLAEGQIVYQGPRQNVLEFFEFMGFKCPERKGVADFLQEVISKKDQEQYWFDMNLPYTYISVDEFVKSFNSFHLGQQLSEELKIPYDKAQAHPATLANKKYGVSNWALFKTCLSREWLLMKRNSFVYTFKTTQITIMSAITMTMFLRTNMHHESIADGVKYFGALFFSLINVLFNGTIEMSMTYFRLPLFYKQRDHLFYPAWAFGLPICLLRIPLSFLESAIWTVLTYYVVGFAPAASRFFRQFLAFFCIHQMALSLFRFIAVFARIPVIANTCGTVAMLIMFILGGFIISKDDIQPWWIWAYWISPMMYGQNAIAINEFLDKRWSTPNNDTNIDAPTIGVAILKSRGMFIHNYWYWLSIGAIVGFSLVFNICSILALTFLNPIDTSHAAIMYDDGDAQGKNISSSNKNHKVMTEKYHMSVSSDYEGSDIDLKFNHKRRNEAHRTSTGLALPFQPLSLTFNHVNYFVDMPTEMKMHGIEESRLQLLRDASGAFRPGILTALVGVTGAGKTTLMDVLAGRKTGGYSDGSINISGYPKNQATFARISGYCEQNDVHSPHVTIYESLIYSAWLRLTSEVKSEIRKMFVDEVLELIELTQLKDALVGQVGVNGLSVEQRKRLTIAVELVANPSIIFMDEPTSGLDARSAAIVMRAIRNTVDTGRTVVCTIHQPSIDIFETFNELLLMKRGGQIIYAGHLGHHSKNLIEYFEAIPGIPKIEDGYNPATWMLDITSPSVEARLNIDFAEIYINSHLYKQNQELIKQLSTPSPGSYDLSFPSKYSQRFSTQFKACLWKQYWSYWRNPRYNAIRFLMTIVIGLLFGTIFWDKGEKTNKQQDLFNFLGAMYAAVLFLGATNSIAVQVVVDTERTVFYRERAAGMYSALSYAFAQVSVEIVYVAAQSLIYALLLFSMMGFTWQGDKFFWFLYFIFMCFAYYTLFGMMAVALTPGHQFAAIISTFFFSLWNLFTGFVVPRMLIPIWWRWYYWANPVAWTLYGLIASQVGDKENMMEIPGQPDVSVKVFLKEFLGYEHSFLGVVAGAHLGFVLLFFFVFAYGINFLNFQKR